MPWTLEYVDGIQLALVGSSADIFDAVSGNLFASFGSDNPLVMGLHDFGSGDAPHYFLFGMAQPDLRQVSIVLEDGTEISVSPDSSHNSALLEIGRRAMGMVARAPIWADRRPADRVRRSVQARTRFDASSPGCRGTRSRRSGELLPATSPGRLDLVVAAEDLADAWSSKTARRRSRSAARSRAPSASRMALLGDRHRVRHDDLLDRRLLQGLARLAAEARRGWRPRRSGRRPSRRAPARPSRPCRRCRSCRRR